MLHYTFPLDGEYEIQVRLTRDRNEQVEGLREPHELELLLDGERVQAVHRGAAARRAKTTSAVDAGPERCASLVTAGPHELGATFLKKPSALLETERQPYQAHFNMHRHPRLHAGRLLGLDHRSVRRRTVRATRRAAAHLCLPARQQPSEEEACAKQILATLMRRAYRRPVTDADLAGPLEVLPASARASGGFEAGIEMGLRAVLVSPEFLFRVERDPPASRRAPPIASATWNWPRGCRSSSGAAFPTTNCSTWPIAASCSTPAVLEQQVRRMLADPRSRALVTNFAAQWLYLRNLDSITPDMRLFPDFDDNLRQAFRQETELFFESIVREDRSVLDLLRADYTFVNERLAKHYGIPNVYGSRFRRVDARRRTAQRGGLLRQGSILTVTSYATRTSPVIRGKWILANLLGMPPPPPPPNVPALKDKHGSASSLDARADGASIAPIRPAPVATS